MGGLNYYTRERNRYYDSFFPMSQCMIYSPYNRSYCLSASGRDRQFIESGGIACVYGTLPLNIRPYSV